MNKFITAYTKGVKDEDKRIIFAKASDGMIDRDKEIIRVSAWTEEGLKSFMSNPVLLLSHNHQGLPIGKVLRLDRRSDGLYFEAKIMKGTERADEVWETIKQIGVCAFSVGFISDEGKEIKVSLLDEEEKSSCLKAGLTIASSVYVHTRVSLLEVSIVSVPSCPTCLLVNYKAGKIKTKSLQNTCRNVMNGETKLDWMKSEIREIAEALEALRKRKRAKPERLKFTEAEFKEYLEEKVAKIDMGALSKKAIDEQIKVQVAKKRGKVW